MKFTDEELEIARSVDLVSIAERLHGEAGRQLLYIERT